MVRDGQSAHARSQSHGITAKKKSLKQTRLCLSFCLSFCFDNSLTILFIGGSERQKITRTLFVVVACLN